MLLVHNEGGAAIHRHRRALLLSGLCRSPLDGRSVGRQRLCFSSPLGAPSVCSSGRCSSSSPQACRPAEPPPAVRGELYISSSPRGLRFLVLLLLLLLPVRPTFFFLLPLLLALFLFPQFHHPCKPSSAAGPGRRRRNRRRRRPPSCFPLSAAAAGRQRQRGRDSVASRGANRRLISASGAGVVSSSCSVRRCICCVGLLLLLPHLLLPQGLHLRQPAASAPVRTARRGSSSATRRLRRCRRRCLLLLRRIHHLRENVDSQRRAEPPLRQGPSGGRAHHRRLFIVAAARGDAQVPQLSLRHHHRCLEEREENGQRD